MSKLDPDPIPSMCQDVNIDILVESSSWNSIEFDLHLYTKQVTLKVLSRFDCFLYADNIELSILLADNAKLQELNRDYRDINKPTNVLSFPNLEIKEGNFAKAFDSKQVHIFLGDIALSYETIYEESVEQEKTIKDHFTHMLVHSILHLLGYDHQNNEEAEIMENLEIEILKDDFDIQNPYRINHCMN